MNNNSKDPVGKFPEEQKQMVFEFAKTWMEDKLNCKIKKLEDKNPRAASWFADRKDQFATNLFLQKDLTCYGKVTNNPVENFNSSLLLVRALPIAVMII